MKRIVLITVRWLITTTSFLLVLGAFLGGVSFLASFYTGQWHWFQRSGALLVSIGAILSTRHLLRVSLDALILQRSYFELVASIDMSRADAADQEARRDLVSAYWGFAVVGFGTVVWAYGDLIECLVARSMVCIN